MLQKKSESLRKSTTWKWSSKRKFSKRRPRRLRRREISKCMIYKSSLQRSLKNRRSSLLLRKRLWWLIMRKKWKMIWKPTIWIWRSRNVFCKKKQTGKTPN